MSIPDEIRQAAAVALKHVGTSSDHEFMPVERLALLQHFDHGGTETAQKARQWLAILSTYHVMSLYHSFVYLSPSESRHLSLRDFADAVDAMRYCRADEAVTLAIRVLQGKASKETAYNVSQSLYAQGDGELVIPLSSMFIEWASVRALEAVCDLVPHFRSPYPNATQLDVDLAVSNRNDSAGMALVAWAMDDTVVKGKCIADAWNTWIHLRHMLPDKMLEFWRWWLTEAIPEAWQLAVQSNQ